MATTIYDILSFPVELTPFYHMAATMYTDAPRGRLVTFLPHGHNHVY